MHKSGVLTIIYWMETCHSKTVLQYHKPYHLIRTNMGVEIANNHVPFYNFDEMLSYDFWCQLPRENEPMKKNVRYVKRSLTL